MIAKKWDAHSDENLKVTLDQFADFVEDICHEHFFEELQYSVTFWANIIGVIFTILYAIQDVTVFVQNRETNNWKRWFAITSSIAFFTILLVLIWNDISIAQEDARNAKQICSGMAWFEKHGVVPEACH